MSKRFSVLVGIMDRLRGEHGCPWDKEQTPESLKPFLIEEAYEVLEAIDHKNPEKLKEELGDLLFQVLFHARIARERDEFDIQNVLSHTIDKMTRRHPHVFGPARKSRRKGSRPSSREVLARWEEIKRGERGNRRRRSVLDGVPISLPALMRAHQLQTRASRVGFDWKSKGPVLGKVREEVRELDEAIEQGRTVRIRSEIGDLLFAVVNLSRFMKLDPEEALRRANRRFERRFQSVERQARGAGRNLSEMSLKEMDRLWEQAKRGERRKGRRGLY